MANLAGGVEARDEQMRRARLGEVGHRAGALADDRPPDVDDALDEDAIALLAEGPVCPTVPRGFQIIEVTPDIAGNKTTVVWTSSLGKTYTISRSTDLQKFIELSDGVEAGDGQTTSFTDGTAPEPEAYYKVNEEE